MRAWAFLLPFLLLAPPAFGQGPGEVLARCALLLKGLEVQALYREDGVTLVLLGRGRPYLLLALEGGRPLPYAGPLRGRPLGRRPLPFLPELTLARRVLLLEGEYRCLVLHRGRVVGVLRLDPSLEPIPLEPPPGP
ncbi:MAG: hypothetical protein WHT26_08885 [Thermus sp.]|uniref:hypothetical protein n=1 Tax=Thermus sp. TaxID=275 RepID=UPI0030B0A2E3